MRKLSDNKLLNGMAIYAIGNFGTKILSFLLVPLYTYYISTTDMGIYDLLLSTASLLTPIVTLQISDAAYRWMIRSEKVEDCIRSTLQVLICNSILAAIVILSFNFFVEIPYCIHFVLLLISSRSLATIQKLLRGLQNQSLFAASGVGYTGIYLLLNVVQICILHRGVESLFVSAIIANVLTIALIFIREKRLRIHLFRCLQPAFIKEMLSYSIPLVPNLLNWWVMNSSDRYIIRYFIDAAANGIYSISYKFPSMLQMVLELFNTAWQDVSIADKEKNGAYYTAVFQKLYRFSLSLLPALIAVTKFYIVFLMSPEYRDAAKYVSFLYMGTVFQSFSSFFGVGYLRDKKTGQASLTSIYGAVINIVVHILLVGFIGLYASAISTFLGFFVMWLLRVKHNRKKLEVQISVKEFVPLFLIALFASLIGCFTSYVIDAILLAVGIVYFALVNKHDIGMIVKRVLKGGK